MAEIYRNQIKKEREQCDEVELNLKRKKHFNRNEQKLLVRTGNENCVEIWMKSYLKPGIEPAYRSD
jgi:hypothetical protein